jgi:hypothetical protein
MKLACDGLGDAGSLSFGWGAHFRLQMIRQIPEMEEKLACDRIHESH